MADGLLPKQKDTFWKSRQKELRHLVHQNFEDNPLQLTLVPDDYNPHPSGDAVADQEGEK